MNTKRQLFTVFAIAAVAVLGAGAAVAQEATSDAWMQAADGMSRAEVLAELADARQPGRADVSVPGYIDPLVRPALRAEVRAQTLQAIQSGELKAINAEVYSFSPLLPQLLAAQ